LPLIAQIHDEMLFEVHKGQAEMASLMATDGLTDGL
jgi:DNA polymerase I-like protein with 3'-5' exonuclease and polymerase domains